jgi:hypothetical protein
MEIQIAKAGQAGSWQNDYDRTSAASSREHQFPPADIVETG